VSGSCVAFRAMLELDEKRQYRLRLPKNFAGPPLRLLRIHRPTHANIVVMHT
jgi:hypothetical protein